MDAQLFFKKRKSLFGELIRHETIPPVMHANAAVPSKFLMCAPLQLHTSQCRKSAAKLKPASSSRLLLYIAACS
jgi:hypothetical protein